MPYTSITQSGVVLDAFSRSRSVVAFDVKGMDQFVPVSELRIKPYDIDAYSSTVIYLERNLARLNALSKELWSFGKDAFTVEAMASKLREVYRASIK